jgi:AcrR family transcriptional regulator
VSDRLPGTERARISSACTEVVAEKGYKATTVEEIVVRAGLDHDAFDRHFSGKEECFLAVWDSANEEYVQRAFAAFASGDSWRTGMRAAANAILDYLQLFPAESRVLIEARNAGARARARLDATMDAFVELVDLGRRELEQPDSLSRATAEGIGGAVFEQVAIWMNRGAGERLPDLLPQVMFLVVQPYLGTEEAMKEMRLRTH